eukprot:2338119-Pyramimonas_sp.AAC.1
MAVFLAKGDEPADASFAVWAPEKTRPISFSDTDNKIVSVAIKIPLGTVCQRVVFQQQRGFVRGRQMLGNILDLESKCLHWLVQQ